MSDWWQFDSDYYTDRPLHSYSINENYPKNYDIADDYIGIGECQSCGLITQLLRTDWGASWCEKCLQLQNNSPSD